MRFFNRDGADSVGRTTGWTPLRLGSVASLLAILIPLGCVEFTELQDNARETLGSTIIDGPNTDDDPAADDHSTDAGGGILSARVTPVFCCNPLEIEFESIPLKPERLSSASYRWSFGDGASAEGASVTHVYEAVDTYVVRLSADGADGSEVIHEVVLYFVLDGLGRTTLTVVSGGDDDVPLNPAEAGVVADAGPDQSIEGGRIVTLDGSGSVNLGGDPAMFLWRQMEGRSVGLVNARAAVTTFRAPSDIDSDVRLSFELKVTAGDAVSSDVVEVTVTAPLGPAGTEEDPEEPQPPGPPNDPEEDPPVEDPSSDDPPDGPPDDDPPGDDPPDEDPPEEDPPPDEDPEEDAINRNPRAIDTVARTETDRPVTIRLHGEDPDGEELTFRVVLPPQHGSLGPIQRTGGTTAEVEFTPNSRYVGADALTFVATDGEDQSNLGGVAIHVDARVDLQEPDIFSTPAWAARWLRNFRESEHAPFGRLIVLAAVTYPGPNSVEDVGNACDALRAEGWRHTVGIGHFGQESLDDWLSREFWAEHVDDFEYLVSYVDEDRVLVIDWEPYLIQGSHRYPWPEDYPRLRVALQPIVEVFVEHGITLGEMQSRPTYLMNRVFLESGVPVVAYSWASRMAPYEYREPGNDWLVVFNEQQEEFAGLGITSLPTVYAYGLVPEFQAELDRLPVGKYAVFFAGESIPIPGAGTREDYYHWGLDEWDPFRPED